MVLIKVFIAAEFINPPPVFGSKNDLEKEGLSDTVRSLKEIVYSVSSGFDNMQYDQIISDQYTFYNTDGNKLETYTYKEGLLFSVVKYEYDENNHKSCSKDFTANGELYLPVTYSTNQKGFITEAIYDRSLQKMFDDKRNPIDVEYEKYYQNLYTKIVYQNSYNGNVQTEAYFKPDGDLSGKYVYGYDFRRVKISAKYYNSERKLSWKKKFTYNSRGDVEVCKLIISHRLAMTSTFEYEYDDKGNWTKRVENKVIEESILTQDLDGNTTITLREIEYYY
nr:hypothetical protein [Bacteroidota bacterium]